MPQIMIPWLSQEVLGRKLFRKALRDEGFGVERFTDLNPALLKFYASRCPLILMDLTLAPGDNFFDEEIERILHENPVHLWKVGLYGIRRIRESGSENENTPILVTDMYDRRNDALLGNTEERCLEAGATEYLDLNNLQKADFVSKVKGYLTK